MSVRFPLSVPKWRRSRYRQFEAGAHDVRRATLEVIARASGRRRQRLELEFDRLLWEDLENRVLDFDSAAAAEAASLAAARQKSGRSVDMRDTQIAGIALARHVTLATRNVRHFADLEISIVDPWLSA